MFRRSVAALSMICAVPAVAQVGGDDPARTKDVVVVGKSKGEIDRQSRQFLESILPTSPADVPVARFEINKVCPVAVGLTPALDRTITARLRQVASAAAIDLDKATCAPPNALVLFADDIKPTIAMLERRYVGMFVDIYGMPVHVASKGPVVVWHLSSPVNQDSELLNPEETGGLLINRTARQASRIEAPVHKVFTLKVVLIERKAVEGLTATQVADYAAMRVFVDTRPPRPGDGAAEGQPNTILSAIEAPMGTAVPASLTAWDLGLLRGIYSTSSSLRASPQRGEVASAITRNVMEAPATTK